MVLEYQIKHPGREYADDGKVGIEREILPGEIAAYLAGNNGIEHQQDRVVDGVEAETEFCLWCRPKPQIDWQRCFQVLKRNDQSARHQSDRGILGHPRHEHRVKRQ